MAGKGRAGLNSFARALVLAVIIAFLAGFFSAQALLGMENGIKSGNGSSAGESAGSGSAEAQGAELKAGKYSASVNIVAVTSQGEGVSSLGSVELQPGEGRVLFSVNPFVEPDTQYSVQTAKEVAEKFTGKSLKGFDAIYSVEGTPAQLVGGPSAGASFALATIAAIEGKRIKDSVAITGTILSDERIGQVGGVVEKAVAVAKDGKKLFIVPYGQRNVVYYEPQARQERYGDFIIERVNYVQKRIDLNEAVYAQYGTQVVEVKDISEAAELALE